MQSAGVSNHISLCIDQWLWPIFEADKTRDTCEIYFAIYDVMNEYSSLSLQVIENSLRRNRCWTHLIANERNSDTGNSVEFELPNGSITQYYLSVSAKESLNVSENYGKLMDTGFMTIKSDSDTMRVDGTEVHFSMPSVKRQKIL